jgi:hypothetical protein
MSQSSFPITDDWKSFDKFKRSMWEKAESLAVDVWPDGGFLYTGQAFSDADNLLRRPDPACAGTALPREELYQPDMYAPTANRGTIATYTQQKAEFASYINARRAVRNFIVASLPESFRQKHSIFGSLEHHTISQLLNLMDAEYRRHADTLRDAFQLDLQKEFSTFANFNSDITNFKDINRQLELLNDVRSDFTLRKILKQCTRSIPTIVAAISGYETTTPPDLRNFTSLEDHITTYGAGYLTPVPSAFAGAATASADADEIAALKNTVLKLEKQLAGKIVPPAAPAHQRPSNPKFSSNYCFVHGPGVGHTSAFCSKMIDIVDGKVKFINGFGPEHLTCQTAGVEIGGKKSAGKKKA